MHDASKHWSSPKFEDSSKQVFMTRFLPGKFPIFGQYSDISVTAVKFTDISRFPNNWSHCTTQQCQQHADLICYIIDYNDAMCTAVVAGSDGTESLLTGRVPLQSQQQLYLHDKSQHTELCSLAFISQES